MIWFVISCLVGYACAVFGVAYAFEMYDKRAFLWGALVLLAPAFYLIAAPLLFPGKV